MLRITTWGVVKLTRDDFFICVYFETFMYCSFCAISKVNMIFFITMQFCEFIPKLILIDCHVLSIDISTKLAKGGNLPFRELSPLVSDGGKIITEPCWEKKIVKV